MSHHANSLSAEQLALQKQLEAAKVKIASLETTIKDIAYLLHRSEASISKEAALWLLDDIKSLPAVHEAYRKSKLP